jgi:hypothetical protein
MLLRILFLAANAALTQIMVLAYSVLDYKLCKHRKKRKDKMQCQSL